MPHRQLQFGLRTALLVMVVIGAVLSLRVRSVHHERAAMAQLRQAGAAVSCRRPGTWELERHLPPDRVVGMLGRRYEIVAITAQPQDIIDVLGCVELLRPEHLTLLTKPSPAEWQAIAAHDIPSILVYGRATEADLSLLDEHGIRSIVSFEQLFISREAGLALDPVPTE